MWSPHRTTRRPGSRSKSGSTDGGTVAGPTVGSSMGRLRFQAFEFRRLSSGRCRAKVVLAWADGRQFVGESEGVTSPAGELRCCAVAAVRAPGQAGAARAGRPCAPGPGSPADPTPLSHVDSLGHAVAQADQEAAADSAALDSLHGRGRDTTRATLADSASAPAVRGEDVTREAERLFGPEGRAAVGAAPTPGEPLFDIDVTTFAANRRVLEYQEFFQVDSRDRFEIWLSRLGRYEGMIRERLRARGLPEDLVYLTLIESGLSNTAVSRARAVGMWQFMAATGRNYGLQIDPWVDERRDPFKAADAAANHLQDLVQRLGSVYLAAAAYNAGAGRIERAIRRLPGGGEADNGDDQTFFGVASHRHVRRGTRDYVPKLIAAALIAKQPAHSGFTDLQPLPPSGSPH